MDKHTIELLEFKKIINELCEYCFSVQGTELILSQNILTEPEAIQNLLKLSGGFRYLFDCGEDFPDLDFPDLQDSLKVLEKRGNILEARQLANIARYLTSASRFMRFIKKFSENDSLKEIAANVPELPGVIKEIFKIVEKDGEIREKHIPELKAIKSVINRLQKDVDKIVAGYLDSNKNYWQAKQPSVKDGRVVLALKTNFKGRIKGVIHEVSSTGATSFIEPLDVVEKNNNIVKEQRRYHQEVLRILRELTAKTASFLDEIKSTVENISFLDSLYARADYGRKHKCHPAEHSSNEILLKNARHPLLGNNAIPISLSMSESSRMLIITGPNTGGKTVTLKTAGLLGIMNQFGMEIPADEGSKLIIFDNFFADIGDEQSIEQSLSTFSSHIINLSRIINNSTEKSLILLDELGAGTDPEEGVAIAMALLDHFIVKRSFTLITTHHGILKNYGYTRKGVENASMEFNNKTLTPTYRILLGVPGESHAIDVARHQGIPEEIVQKAFSYLNYERNDISVLIKRLSEKHRELLNVEKSHKIKENKLNELRRETDLKELRLKQKELLLREHGLKDIKDFLKSSRKELEGLVKEIREGELSKEKTIKVKDFISKMEEDVKNEENKLEYIESSKEFEFKVGMAVIHKNTGKQGIIIRRGKKKSWVVETDTLKISVNEIELKPAGNKKNKSEKVEIISSEIRGNAVYELHVRGMRFEEAMTLVKKQIDNAVINGLWEFSIVHGKGEGILCQGIRKYLQESDMIADYCFARPEDGGYGKTIVRLKG